MCNFTGLFSAGSGRILVTCGSVWRDVRALCDHLEMSRFIQMLNFHNFFRWSLISSEGQESSAQSWIWDPEKSREIRRIFQEGVSRYHYLVDKSAESQHKFAKFCQYFPITYSRNLSKIHGFIIFVDEIQIGAIFEDFREFREPACVAEDHRRLAPPGTAICPV